MFRKNAFWSILALSLLALQVAASGPQETGRLVAGKDGLKVYPRLNRTVKPLAVVEEGKTLIVLRELKAWLQVRVEGEAIEGWIVGEVRRSGSGEARTYDTVADPSTTGLVARGWSKEYAASHGTDIDKVKEIRNRSVDPDRFNRFLKGEVVR